MVPFDGLDATRTTDEQFLQLLLADEELLRAEFDALIAAEWSGSPPRRTGRCARAGRRPIQPRRPRWRAAGWTDGPRHPGTSGWARQRSPPL